MNAISQWDQQAVEHVIASLKDKPGALLPILHGIQNSQGFIPTEAVPIIAASLNQTRAEVHGVISFYHHFRMTAPGSHTLQICRAEACQARGSRELEVHVKEKLGIDYHATTSDNEFSLEPVYCLGNCACGPSVRINDDIIGRVTAAKFDRLVDELTTAVLEVK
ncbi:MAG: formate dehydrogenase subunit gamma [Pontibacterium sp.]